jgi:hypothetical protein
MSTILQRAVKSIPPSIGFALCLAALYLVTHQIAALMLGPQGIHFIRQSDSLSFASNYFHFDYGLFEPHVFNLTSTDGAAACEFPLLYYIAAIMYRFTGESFSVLRIIHLAIISCGFIASFQFMHRRVKDFVVATSLTLILITSTVVLYYASNFLVDSAALGLALLGIERFDRFRKSEMTRHYVLSVLFFTLSCLLKITFAIWPLALFGALFSFQKPFLKRAHLALLLPVVSAVIWFSIATLYNQRSGDDYFLTSSIPIWQLSTGETAQLLDAVTHYWVGSYYPPITRWALLIALGLFVWNIKRHDRFDLKFMAIAFVGILCYLLLMGRAFINHDYYFLPIVPWILLLLTSLAVPLDQFKNKKRQLVLSLALIAVVLSAATYTSQKLHRRYFMSNDPFDDAALSIREEISMHRLPMPDYRQQVIVIGDPTRNGTLMHLKSKGMTYPDLQHFESAVNGRDTPENAAMIYSTEALSEEQLQQLSAQAIGNTEHWYCYRINR